MISHHEGHALTMNLHVWRHPRDPGRHRGREQQQQQQRRHLRRRRQLRLPAHHQPTVFSTLNAMRQTDAYAHTCAGALSFHMCVRPRLCTPHDMQSTVACYAQHADHDGHALTMNVPVGRHSHDPGHQRGREQQQQQQQQQRCRQLRLLARHQPTVFSDAS